MFDVCTHTDTHTHEKCEPGPLRMAFSSQFLRIKVENAMWTVIIFCVSGLKNVLSIYFCVSARNFCISGQYARLYVGRTLLWYKETCSVVGVVTGFVLWANFVLVHWKYTCRYLHLSILLPEYIIYTHVHQAPVRICICMLFSVLSLLANVKKFTAQKL